MATTYEMGKKFKEETLSKIVFQNNSNAHKAGVWIEVLELSRDAWIQPPWLANNAEILIVGNDKISFFLSSSALIYYLQKHILDIKFSTSKTSIGLNIPITQLIKFPNYITNKKLGNKTLILHAAAEVLKNESTTL